MEGEENGGSIGKAIRQASMNKWINMSLMRRRADSATMKKIESIIKMHTTFVEELVSLYGYDATAEGLSTAFAGKETPEFRDILNRIREASMARKRLN